MSLLDTITCPDDVKALPADLLPRLADEIRRRLVDTVTANGGHLGPNLGVVELTIALHRVFDSPRDLLVWDTGHQAYVHKLLTGRAAGFGTLRQAGGLSGYPSRAESAHDLVENSHASTALSYADGLAKALAVRRDAGRHVVAVVGDGALTGGMAWEALNNIATAPHRPVIVVLNDNGRSYAPTIGGLGAQLQTLSSSPSWQLAYLGPVDGHDVAAVEAALRAAAALGTPVVVHCRTEKGRGFAAAERDDADRLHGVSPAVAAVTAPAASRRSWTDVFGEEIAAIGRARPDVVAITAAMCRPVGLHAFAAEHPERFFDVGIAEQHAVTSAAGLAMGGLHPVVCLYSTFLNRAFDQLLLDVALHRLPVTFVLDRAGVTGDDGPSHHGMWDLSLLGLVPGLRLAAPRDATRLGELLREAVDDGAGPTVLRFPKAQAGVGLEPVARVGSADVLHADLDASVLLVTAGAQAAAAVEAARRLSADGVRVTVVDPRWLLPVDDALLGFARRHRVVVTIEDGGASGGYGDAWARALRAHRAHDVELLTLGLPQQFLPHGRRPDLLAEHGLDAAGIAAAVRGLVGDTRALDDTAERSRVVTGA